MGGRGRLLPWEIYKVWDDWIEGSGCCEAPNRYRCSDTIIDNILRAYAGSSYHHWAITKAACADSAGKKSNEARFGESSGTQSHSISPSQRFGWFVTAGDCEARSTRVLLLLHKTSLGNYHAEIRFGRRHVDGSCVTRGVDSQIGFFKTYLE